MASPRPARSRGAPSTSRGETPAREPLTIIGIGASAGGLEALTQFFDAVPKELIGVAFVLIQHLDPRHVSLAPELLQRHTTMKVVQAETDTPVEADHVYVIPPNHYLAVAGGVLGLSEFPGSRSVRMPIDFFFRSLARDRAERAVGIVLSGTGSDGTAGLKEIKGAGGLTLAQRPETAQYDGMPRSAIGSGVVDRILAPAEMPRMVLGYARSAYLSAHLSEAESAKRPRTLQDVISLLRARTKFDFAPYKVATIGRRVERRMSLRRLHDVAAYLDLLRNDAAEVTALFNDLLISVSSFFRDAAAWAVLEKEVIPEIVGHKEDGAAIRVWVPGCASGEEPFSLAMLLVEGLEAAGRNCAIQIFASDVDEEALELARAGVYPEGITTDVSPARLRRFFTQRDQHYVVKKELRDAVVFARQNLLADPPYSRLDLVSCRNLLIYLEPGVQRRILSLLHFSLVSGGTLFLGSAETIGGADDLFETVDQKWRIYRRVGPTRHDLVHFPVSPTSRPTTSLAREEASAEAPVIRGLPAIAQSLLSARYMPACVIINRKHEILYFAGPTQDYLAQPEGIPTEDLFEKAPEGLEARLRVAVRKAIHDENIVVVNGHVRRGTSRRKVTITVEPLRASKETKGLLLVTFEDQRPTANGKAGEHGQDKIAAENDAALMSQLEQELKTTREDLQATIEELETSNEELRAANEEVMSVNEELQSTNEELETSKEELQSLNEEISTVNSQLEAKVEELERANDDLGNFLRSSDVATLFLDPELRVRRFTPAMTRILRLIPADTGRPITDFAHPFTTGDFVTAARDVLDHLTPVEAEVRTEDQQWFLRRILPYRTEDDRIEGVVVTFVDITARKEAEIALEALNRQLEERVDERTERLIESEARLRGIIETATEGIIAIDRHGTVLSFNPAAEKMFGYGAGEVVGKNVKRLLPPNLRKIADEAVERFLRTEAKTIVGKIREVIVARKDGTEFPVELAVSRFHDEGGKYFTGVVRDITARKRAEAEAQRRQEELARVLRLSTAGELAAGIIHEIGQPLAAIVNHLEACASAVEAGEGSPNVPALLREATADALRAGEIAQRLRDFLANRELHLEIIDLRDLVDTVVRFVRGQIEEKGIDIRVDRGREPVPAEVDRVQMEQVILNLVQNAIDAVQEAKIHKKEIRIELGRKKKTVEIAVHDTGGGIGRARPLEELFETFFTTKAGGLGMGLSISRAIVEAHKGRISLERRADHRRGTTARVTLPLQKR